MNQALIVSPETMSERNSPSATRMSESEAGEHMADNEMSREVGQ